MKTGIITYLKVLKGYSQEPDEHLFKELRSAVMGANLNAWARVGSPVKK